LRELKGEEDDGEKADGWPRQRKKKQGSREAGAKVESWFHGEKLTISDGRRREKTWRFSRSSWKKKRKKGGTKYGRVQERSRMSGSRGDRRQKLSIRYSWKGLQRDLL